MHADHEPRNEFVERLAWQVEAEARRRNREAVPRPWPFGSPAIRAVAIAGLVVVSMGVGGVVVAASYQAQTNERRNLLADGIERRLSLAEERMTLAKQALQTIDTRVSVGLATDIDRLDARLKVTQAEAEIQSLRLQLEEVRLTGLEPVTTVSAPLVAGRDFVSDRWKTDLMSPEAALSAARMRLAAADARQKVGTGSQTDVLTARAEFREVEAAVNLIRRKLSIRQDFLRGRVTALQADLRVLESEAETRIEALQPKLTTARERLALVTARVKVGAAQHVEQAEATLYLHEVEADLAKAQLDLALVRKRLSGGQPR